MRVISGFARGRKLSDININIRPTSDFVKESVYNIIQFDIEGRQVLDLFAGSGQLGIEALSRGAKSVVFVDSNPGAVKLINGNLKLCGFDDAGTVYSRDAIKFLETDPRRFDIVFVDPPYDTTLVSKALSVIIGIDKLNPNGIIICETTIDTEVPTVCLPYFFYKEYKYGNTKIIRCNRE